VGQIVYQNVDQCKFPVGFFLAVRKNRWQFYSGGKVKGEKEEEPVTAFDAESHFFNSVS